MALLMINTSWRAQGFSVGVGKTGRCEAGWQHGRFSWAHSISAQALAYTTVTPKTTSVPPVKGAARPFQKPRPGLARTEDGASTIGAATSSA
jgi:hypothetical protein